MFFIKRLLVDHWGRRKDNFDWRVRQGPLDLNAVKSVLILHLNSKLGDSLVISLLVDAFARERPDLAIDVGTTSEYVEYWRRHPNVRAVETFPGSKRLMRRMGRRISEARKAGISSKGRYDVVVSFEPYASPDHFALLRALAAPVVIGFNKLPYRLFTYSLEERRHTVPLSASSVAMRTARVLEVFDREIDIRELAFHAPFYEEDERAVRSLVETSVPGPKLLFNTYGASHEKRLSPASIAKAVREIRRAGHAGPIFLSVPPRQEGVTMNSLQKEGLETGVSTIKPVADFFKLFALVSAVDWVVSPDTAVGHIAAAFGKPQVCLFARQGTIPVAWKPFSDRCESVVSTSGKNVNDLQWDAFGTATQRALAFLGKPSTFPGVPGAFEERSINGSHVGDELRVVETKLVETMAERPDRLL